MKGPLVSRGEKMPRVPGLGPFRHEFAASRPRGYESLPGACRGPEGPDRAAWRLAAMRRSGVWLVGHRRSATLARSVLPEAPRSSELTPLPPAEERDERSHVAAT